MESSEQIVSSQNDFQVNLESLDYHLQDSEQVEQEAEVREDEEQTEVDETPEENETERLYDRHGKPLSKAEYLYRQFQSKYDKLFAEHQKLVQELEEKRKLAELVEKALEDESYLYALVGEIKPDLLPKPDIRDLIKRDLAKEFGENYRPSLTREQAEIEDPGGKDWLYYRRIDELYNKYKNLNQELPENLAKLKEKKEKEKQLQAQQYERVLNDIKQKYKATDDEIKAVFEFWQNIKPEELFKIHRFLRRFPTLTPSLERAPSLSRNETTNNARLRFLNSL